MNIINIALGVDTQPCSSITLGRRGENEVTQVVVDFSSWVEDFGAGVITLLAMRSQDTSAYPVVLTLDGNTATWDVTSTDTAYKGSGRAEYIYTVGEQIAKSVVFGTTVLQDIGEPSETPPDPYEDWLERLTELGAETQANAEAAQQSAEDAEQSAQEAAQEAANAEGYAEQAGESASAAQSAEAASESARDAAQTAQASAEASATAASGSAASAAGSATAAAGSASDASASATAAGASATAAGNAATQAESAKTAAQTAQSAAEDAAEDAQQAAQQAHVEYEQLSGEVDDLSDEVADQKSAIEALEDLTDRKAGMLVDTASGAIASFTPDSTIDNLLGLTVDIEPVQDLHGYDAPWPAGGGVNKFDVGAVTSADFSISDGTFTNTQTDTRTFFQLSVQQLNNGAYVKSVAAYSAANTGRIFAKISGIEAGITSLIIKHNGSTRDLVLCNYPWTGTDDLWISLNIVSNNPTVAGGLVISDIQLEIATAGSTQASAFTPYSNICPISGWDAVEVEDTGINVWDEEWEAGGISDTTGEKIPQSSRIRSKNYIPCVPNTSYCLVSPLTSNDVRIAYYRADFSFISMTPWTVNGAFTTNASAHYMMFFTAGAYGNTYHNDISINYPNTATDYHPYAGNRYTIALGDTVYGGTLTVNADGSGSLVVDKAMYLADGSVTVSSVSHHSSGLYYTIVATKIGAKETNPLPISNRFKPLTGVAIGNCYITSLGQLIIAVLPDQSITTKADATQWFADNPTQFVYELATPIEIQLDPVQITAIAGQTNIVWADAGDVSVEFAADLKTYIDSKIAAAVAALS